MLTTLKAWIKRRAHKLVSFSPPVGYALTLVVLRMAITHGDRLAAHMATANTSRAARFSPSLRGLYYKQRNALRA